MCTIPLRDVTVKSCRAIGHTTHTCYAWRPTTSDTSHSSMGTCGPLGQMGQSLCGDNFRHANNGAFELRCRHERGRAQYLSYWSSWTCENLNFFASEFTQAAQGGLLSSAKLVFERFRLAKHVVHLQVNLRHFRYAPLQDIAVAVVVVVTVVVRALAWAGAVIETFVEALTVDMWVALLIVVSNVVLVDGRVDWHKTWPFG